MNKQKGFTLIELLAVILILGIIALIAIPTVSKIIDQSKKGAFEATVNNMVRAAEDKCSMQLLKGEPLTTTYTIENGVSSPSLNVKGKLPTSGTINVDSNCNTTVSVNNGTFTATKASTTDSVTVVDSDEVEETQSTYANGEAVYFNPVSGAVCAAGDAVSTTGTNSGCMKWYAFNDSGASSENINLILDHNTTTMVAWNSTNSTVSGPSDILTQLQTDTSSWAGVPNRTDSYSVSNGTSTYTINYSSGYKARLISAAEIATITGKSTFVEATNIGTGWFYLDSNNQTQAATTTGASNYDWLFDYTNGCTSYGCNIADATTYGYWTSTAIPGDIYFAWGIYFYGSLQNVGDPVINPSSLGVRPVITIPKSLIS